MKIIWILLIACQRKEPPPAEHRPYADALKAAETSPERAGALCAALPQPTLAADCAWAVVERLASSAPDQAVPICAGLDGRASEECWFILAEGSKDSAWCTLAGGFEQDCRMHLLTEGLKKLEPSLAPGTAEGPAATLLKEVGFFLGDPAPWSAVYRHLLANQRPLDRGSCSAVAEPLQKEACFSTALSVFHDRLNRSRDTGGSLCEGPLPPEVAYLPDPEMDLALRQRRAADLCRPDATRAPPPGARP